MTSEALVGEFTNDEAGMRYIVADTLPPRPGRLRLSTDMPAHATRFRRRSHEAGCCWILNDGCSCGTAVNWIAIAKNGMENDVVL